MLEGRGPLSVVGIRSDHADTMADLKALRPDVVLLDAPPADLRARIVEMRDRTPGLRVVALAVADEVESVTACAEAGVAGYVTWDASREDLVAVVESAVRGELRCSPEIAGRLLERLGALAAERDSSLPSVRLTAREQEIVGLIRQDLSNKEIAGRLGIEVATVKNHVHNVLEKLNVHRRTQAARLL